eukprot:COSAG05_NODE_4388_length_1535_cov_1.107939_2_plen_58_part_01
MIFWSSDTQLEAMGWQSRPPSGCQPDICTHAAADAISARHETGLLRCDRVHGLSFWAG